MEFSDDNDNDNDNYETLTEGGMEKKAQKLLDEQDIYQTLVIGPNNRTNQNPNEPNKIVPNSGVPPNEKEKEKQKREPSSDAPHPLSQQYQPEREAQHQIPPKVLRNPNKPSSPSELQITSNPNVQPNDPSGRETGRFPSQNPKLNSGSIPEPVSLT